LSGLRRNSHILQSQGLLEPRASLPVNCRYPVPLAGGADPLVPKTWWAPRRTFPRGAPSSSRQSAYKPGSGWRAGSARMRDGHSSWAPVARRLQQPTRTAGSGHRPRGSIALSRKRTPRRPYSVLLPVGFAVPPALPPTRCALTAPFHPCRSLPHSSPKGRSAGRGRRSVLCGTFPGLAPAGCYPAPLVHGARTFLPGNPCPFLSGEGEGRVGATGATVRPTDIDRDGGAELRRQEAARRAKSRARAAIVLVWPRWESKSHSVLRVEASAMPSTRWGRKWR
jgi:hypothetical protein